MGEIKGLVFNMLNLKCILDVQVERLIKQWVVGLSSWERYGKVH